MCSSFFKISQKQVLTPTCCILRYFKKPHVRETATSFRKKNIEIKRAKHEWPTLSHHMDILMGETFVDTTPYTQHAEKQKWLPKLVDFGCCGYPVYIIYELSNIMRKIHIYTPQPQIKDLLEASTTKFKMDVWWNQPFSKVKNWNHPIETNHL